MREMYFLLHPLLPVTGERAGPRVRRERTTSALQQLPHTGELTPAAAPPTPITAAAARIKGPAPLLGKTVELTLLV